MWVRCLSMAGLRPSWSAQCCTWRGSSFATVIDCGSNWDLVPAECTHRPIIGRVEFVSDARKRMSGIAGSLGSTSMSKRASTGESGCVDRDARLRRTTRPEGDQFDVL
jgi:hypothetical protein